MAKDTKKKSENTDQTISDIVRGMQYAVNTAQEVLQDHQFRLMKKYFNTKTGRPLMRHIVLPDGREVSIPLLTLIPSNILSIDELEMNFSVKIASAFVKTFEDKIEVDNGKEIIEKRNRTSLGVFFSSITRKKNSGNLENTNDIDTESDADVITIKMKFKSVEEPEAASRIREMLYNQIL